MGRHERDFDMLRRILPWRQEKQPESAKLIVGLGNPGPEHAGNRHNVGFHVIDRLADRLRLSLDKFEAQGLLARGTVSGTPVILLRPLSYMNRSGSVVKPIVSRYKVRPEDLLVVHDDLDLPLGKVRIRAGGGSAGHRGMQSIISALRTSDIARIRIGIGRSSGEPPEEYVLEDFSLDESIAMETAYDQAIAAVLCFTREGIAAAMNKHN
jgi:PTH1 family peptidyl-tRNA hydrolase